MISTRYAHITKNSPTVPQDHRLSLWRSKAPEHNSEKPVCLTCNLYSSLVDPFNQNRDLAIDIAIPRSIASVVFGDSISNTVPVKMRIQNSLVPCRDVYPSRRSSSKSVKSDAREGVVFIAERDHGVVKAGVLLIPKIGLRRYCCELDWFLKHY